MLKHRTERTSDVEVEVKLTVKQPVTTTYTNKPQETLNLKSDAQVEAERRSLKATLPHFIESELSLAAAHSYPVYITGTKVSGERYERRCVWPKHVQGGALHCEVNDEQGSGSRAYRLDGIEKVEVPL